MAFELKRIDLPASAVDLQDDFGRICVGPDLSNMTDEEFKLVEDALYKHSILIFPNTSLSSENQYKLTRRFEPLVANYGHGATPVSSTVKSILHPDLKTIPHQPQVQLIGNGFVAEHEGLHNVTLKHPCHTTFHNTRVSATDETAGITRFYRWHCDAALYHLNPPKVTTLYAIEVPEGPDQLCVYDDGTGDQLAVPLGTTAFVSGSQMFESLSPELKSVAVRMRVKYAPHPYTWMAKCRAIPTGLGLESQCLEQSLDELPPWKEEELKILPALWKNINGRLFFQVHPCAVMELLIAPEENAKLYPSGAHLTDLKEVRSLLYQIQRPAISPPKVLPVRWSSKDLVIFANQQVLHTVVGAFTPEQVRMFHQCNLASETEPMGPNAADIAQFA